MPWGILTGSPELCQAALTPVGPRKRRRQQDPHRCDALQSWLEQASDTFPRSLRKRSEARHQEGHKLSATKFCISLSLLSFVQQFEIPRSCWASIFTSPNKIQTAEALAVALVVDKTCRPPNIAHPRASRPALKRTRHSTKQLATMFNGDGQPQLILSIPIYPFFFAACALAFWTPLCSRVSKIDRFPSHQPGSSLGTMAVLTLPSIRHLC